MSTIETSLETVTALLVHSTEAELANLNRIVRGGIVRVRATTPNKFKLDDLAGLKR